MANSSLDQGDAIDPESRLAAMQRALQQSQSYSWSGSDLNPTNASDRPDMGTVDASTQPYSWSGSDVNPTNNSGRQAAGATALSPDQVAAMTKGMTPGGGNYSWSGSDLNPTNSSARPDMGAITRAALAVPLRARSPSLQRLPLRPRLRTSRLLRTTAPARLSLPSFSLRRHSPPSFSLPSSLIPARVAPTRASTSPAERPAGPLLAPRLASEPARAPEPVLAQAPATPEPAQDLQAQARDKLALAARAASAPSRAPSSSRSTASSSR